MNEKKIIGRQLQQYREEKLFTQGWVAEKCCISVNYLSSIERGISFPRIEILIRLFETLKAPPDGVFQGVLSYLTPHQEAEISAELNQLLPQDKKRILEVMKLMIQQCRQNRM